ncbi:MAG: LytTR family DNA-binding domain-containing protein [Bacteroidales bacterium]
MRVLIVEDETAAYKNLMEIILKISPEVNVVGCTESVRQTVRWLRSNQLPDLILMDIHLSDGSAFSIFEKIEVETPVIFITAYDEYAIEAFKVNSIDYLLKPVKEKDLKRAIEKFKKLTRHDLLSYLENMTHVTTFRKYKDKILISVKDKLLPVDINDISFFYTTDKKTSIHLKDGKSYPYSGSLEQMESELNPSEFIRANKQFIIARKSIKSITVWFDNRLLITLDTETPERVYISKNKAAEFKAWVVKGEK